MKPTNERATAPGPSGSRADLYAQTGIDAAQIANAALLALELAEG